LTLSLITEPFQIATGAWSEFVYAHPEGTVFQSPEMYEFFQSVPKFSPIVLAVKNGNGLIQGILLAVTIREMKGLTAFFSSRTVIYGGPLIAASQDNHDEVLEILLKGLIKAVSRNSIFIQFRNFFSNEAIKAVFESSGFHLRDRLNLIVDTSDREMVIRNMSASRWRQIRKGLGIQSAVGSRQSAVCRPEPGISGKHARIIIPSSISQVREFYDILYGLYRYKVKKPLPPWEFFEQFYIFSQRGKLGVILLVEFRGKIIGGILSPVTPEKTIYEWYVCGLDQEYKEIHPSVLATWAAIEYALEQSIPKFDFMGVGIPEREYGVRKFKARFGGEMVNFGRFARISNRLFYGIAEAGYNILSVLKKI